MLSVLKKYSIWVWLFIGIPLITFFILRKSFNLGLYGDDWQRLYDIFLMFDVHKQLSWFSLSSYIGAYWPQHLFFGIIRHFWEFNPLAYFIASYIFRVLAAISLYFAAVTLTKNKLAAFLSTIFFGISAAGLETTDWVMNMNTYTGMFFFNLAFGFYIKLVEQKLSSKFTLILFALNFLLALFIVPVRMHGAILTLLLADIFLLLILRKKRTLKETFVNKKFLIRASIAVIIVLILKFAGSYGTTEYSADRIKTGLRVMEHFISEGRIDFLFYPIAILGHIIIPDTLSLNPLISFASDILTISNQHLGVVLLAGLISTILGLMVTYLSSKKLPVFLTVILFNLVWILVTMLLYENNPKLSPNVLFSIFNGGSLIFLSIFTFLLNYKKQPYLSSSLIIMLFWIASFTALFWLSTPDFIIETTGRYLILGAAGFAVLLSSFILINLNNLKNIKNTNLNIASRILLLTLAIIFSISHIIAGQRYFNQLDKSRNQALTQRSWDTLMKEVPVLDPNGPSVFLITSDNPSSLFGVFTFGFWPRAGVLYKIPNQNNTPIMVEDYNSLLEAAKTGKPLTIHAREQIPVPLDRIYAFELKNGGLINKTLEIREKVKKDLGQ